MMSNQQLDKTGSLLELCVISKSGIKDLIFLTGLFRQNIHMIKNDISFYTSSLKREYLTSPLNSL